MHGVLFELKRCHLRAQWFGRLFCRAAHGDMTPARFDILHVVSRWLRGFYTEPGVVPRQVLLARALGVTPVTVSKMLRRLEQLGYVQRVTAPEDRRCKRVSLTPSGKAALRATTEDLVEPDVVQFLFQGGFGAPLECSGHEAAARVSALYRELLFLAVGLLDRATFRYPRPVPRPWYGPPESHEASCVGPAPA